MKKIIILLAFIGSQFAQAQNVGINTSTPDNSAALDITATDKGMLVPRMTQAQRNAIVLPATGLLLFQTDAAAGFYYYNGAAWTLLEGFKSKIQDADATTKIETEHTPNEDKIRFTLNGTEYFQLNKGSLEVLNTGGSVFMGKEAGLNEVYSGDNRNVGVGYQALKITQSSFDNVAVGSRALWSQSNGNGNVAVGTEALRSNDADANTAIGAFAGAENAGLGNVFIGHHAGENALGDNKLYIANDNTATPLLFGDFTSKKLTVNDSLQTKYLRLPTGATDGYILQSDAMGRASWAAPTVFSESDPKVGSLTTNKMPKWNGASLTDGQVFDNGTNVGIGTNTPNFKLHVNGTVWGEILATNTLQADAINVTDVSTDNLNVATNAYIEDLEVMTRTKTANLQMTTGATNGYVLKSDAAGNATWVNPTTLPITYTETDPKIGVLTTNKIAKWNGTTLSDGQIFDNGTNIGIGTTAPSQKLEVNGTTKTTNLQMTTGATNGYVLKSDAAGNATWVNPTTLPVTYTETDPQVSAVTTNKVPKWNGTTLVDGAIYDTGTNVGIGVAAPFARFEVNGEARATALRAAAGIVVDANNSNTGTNVNTLTFGDSSGEGIGSDRSPTNSTHYGLDFYTAHLNRMTINNDGNVGIGEPNPSYKLDVSGTASVANLKITSGATNGYVLQSDATGNAAWVNSTTLSITETDPKVGNLTTNYLSKWNGTSLANTQIFDNAINVGIGTSLPTYKLHVESGTTNVVAGLSNASTTGAWLRLANTSTGGTDWNMVSTGSSNGEGAGSLLFKDNTTVRMILKAGGNIGIGTTTPTQKLEVNGTTKTAGLQLTTGATNGYVLQSDASGNGAWVNPESLAIAETDPKVGNLTTNYLSKWNGTSLANTQIFDNATNVGIGTSLPTYKLHIESGAANVVAGLSSASTTGAWLRLANTSTGGTDWNMISTGSGNGEGAGSLLFRDNATVRMVLKAGGNIGIGTATPTQKLEVNGTTKTAGLQLTTGATSGYILSSDASGNATWSNPNGLITIAENDPKVGSLSNNYMPKWNGSSLANSQVYDNGTVVSIGTTTLNNGKFVVAASMNGTGTYGYLNSDGSTGTQSNTLSGAPYSIYAVYRIAAASFNAFSDKRIKNVIGVSNNENDLALLAKIRITDYKMIDTIAKGNQVHKKVIAQEVAEILPSAVSKTTEFIPNIYKIASLNPSEGGTSFINLENNGLMVGDKVKLFFDTKEEVVEVLNVNEKGFYVNSKETTAPSEEGRGRAVFVFGKLVNDFHTVDYEALSTLNISATQALLKRLNDAEAKAKTQETRLEEQASRLSKLEAIIFKTTADH